MKNAAAYQLSLCLGLLLPIGASALGLGELRGEAVLGSRIAFDIEILGAEKLNLESNCFKLVQPSAEGDLPWLRKASLSFRQGQPALLEIRSQAALLDPVLQISIRVGCGYETSRSYVAFATPSGPGVGAIAAQSAVRVASLPPAKSINRDTVPASAHPDGDVARRRGASRRAEDVGVRAQLAPMPIYAEGVLLRMATGLAVSEPMLSEDQRDIYRLEFRMLDTLYAQAAMQLSTAERLRSMETTLADLRHKSAEFASRVEKGGAIVSRPQVASPTAGAKAPPVQASSPWSGLYLPMFGVLFGAVAGAAAWLGWKRYMRRREEGASQLGHGEEVPTLLVDTATTSEPAPDVAEFDRSVDLPFESDAAYQVKQIDLEIEEEAVDDFPGKPQVAVSQPVASIGLDMPLPGEEGFSRAVPVLELAEIMLSFGRTQGALQTLRDFLEAYPDDSPRLWIRLLEVCRMAGLQEEFEGAAIEFHQHFNVKIDSWEELPAVATGLPWEELEPRSLEDVPRLMAQMTQYWADPQILGYLHHLMRDNRGGERTGFPLVVFEDILCLAEIKETIIRMERES